MSKSKDDILFKINACLSYGETFYHGEQIKAAMDIYAEQEVKSNSQALSNLIYETCNLPEFLGQQTTLGELRDAIKLHAQLQSIAFDEWKHKNKWVQYLGFDTPSFNKGGKPEAGKQFYFSSTELYTLFTQDQIKQQKT